MRHITKLVACLLVLLGPLGCKTSLEPGGPYTDLVLFDADLAITTSWAVCDAVTRWEADNRVVLATVPEIKRAVDEIRRNAPELHRQAIAARDAYAALGTLENATHLDIALTALRAIAAQAAGILTTYGVIQ